MTANLLDFPNEILQAIAMQCDAESAVNIWGVNKRFRNITRNDDVFLKAYWVDNSHNDTFIFPIIAARGLPSEMLLAHAYLYFKLKAHLSEEWRMFAKSFTGACISDLNVERGLRHFEDLMRWKGDDIETIQRLASEMIRTSMHCFLMPDETEWRDCQFMLKILEYRPNNNWDKLFQLCLNPPVRGELYSSETRARLRKYVLYGRVLKKVGVKPTPRTHHKR